MTRRTLEDLHEYQKKMINWLLVQKKCALWAGVGLGKTITTLTALSHLFAHKKINKALIIAPLRVAKFVWPSEIDRWDHTKNLTHTVLHGNKKERLQLIHEDTDIHIINKEMITWLIDQMALTGEWPYDVVVVDESTCIKSPKSQRFKSLRSTRMHVKYIWELSATPAPNGLLDLWAPMHFIDGGLRLGLTMTAYKTKFFQSTDYYGYTWSLKPGSEQDIYALVEDKCLTLTSEDHLELPPKNDNFIELDMEPDTRDMYDSLESSYVLEVEGRTLTASQAAVLSGKLLQFCGGAIYTDAQCLDNVGINDIGDTTRWVEIHNQKILALRDLVDEMVGQPLIVAYSFRHELERLLKAFRQARTLNTQQDEQDWNDGEIPLLFVHPASCGHGLNLQYGGSNLIWYSLTWNLEFYDQLNGRIDRQGQTEPVFIHHLIFKDSIDTLVAQRLQDKSITQQSLLNAMKEKHHG